VPDSGRDVGVLSTLDESAILAVLRAHGLDPFVKAVAGRRGLDMSTVEAGWGHGSGPPGVRARYAWAMNAAATPASSSRARASPSFPICRS